MKEQEEMDRDWYCTWCDELVEEVKELEFGEHIVGRCEEDGIVYVKPDPDEDVEAYRLKK